MNSYYNKGRSKKYNKTDSSSYPSNVNTKYKTTADNQLVVYRNPFSMATTNPKIPDGKCSYSAGIRLQAVREFVNNRSPEMQFVLFPGLKAGLTKIDFHPVNATQDAYTDWGDLQNQSYSEHLRYTNLIEWVPEFVAAANGNVALATTPVADNALATHMNLQQGNTDSPISKWRIVSQGVRFSLTNNSDENDGWWEAIRIPLNIDNWEYYLERTYAVTDGVANPPNQMVKTLKEQDPAVVPDESLVFTRGSRNWVEHPTYTTGKIRDLHRYLFQLKPSNNDHDFTQVKSYYGGVPLTRLERVGNESPAQAFVAANLDATFDQILIRMHGRVSGEVPFGQVPNVPNLMTPTRIMAHLVTNMEVVFDDNGFLSRFHTECKSSHKFAQAKKSIVESSNSAAQKLKLQYSG